MEESRLTDLDHNPASSDLLERKGVETSIAKKREPGSTKMEPPRSIEEPHAKQLKIQTTTVYNYSAEVISIDERKWNDIPAYQYFKGHTFEAEV